MMIGRIFRGYLGALGALGRLTLLAGVCLAAGLAVTWPLWRLATAAPGIFTALCALLFAASAAFFAMSRMRTAWRLNPARFRRSLLQFAVLAAGLSLSVALVLAWHRFAALGALLVTAAVWGYLAFADQA